MSTLNNSTNIFWQECPVGKVERQKLLNQKGCVVWITGLSGSGSFLTDLHIYFFSFMEPNTATHENKSFFSLANVSFYMIFLFCGFLSSLMIFIRHLYNNTVKGLDFVFGLSWQFANMISVPIIWYDRKILSVVNCKCVDLTCV